MLSVFKAYPLICLMGIGFVIGVPMMWKYRAKIGLEKFWQIFLLSIACSVSGFIGMKLLGFVEGLLGTQGGTVRIYGVFFFESLILLMIAKLIHLNVGGFFDSLAVVSIPSMFFGRIGCIVEGCCGGKMIPGTSLRWPTRESELVFYLIIFVVFLHLERANHKKGQLFPLLMIVYGCFRFINEFFRTGSILTFGLHLAHIWSILCVMIGASILFEMKLRAVQKAAHENRHRRK